MAENYFDRFDEKPSQSSKNYFDKFDAPKKEDKVEPSTFTHRKAEAVKTLGSGLRGLATGALGGPGDIEKFVHYDIPGFFGREASPAEKTFFGGTATALPTSEELEQALQWGEKKLGLKPGVEPKHEDIRKIGEFAGGFVSPGATAYKILEKPIQKGAQLISRARGKPLEEALKTMTTSAEDIARSKSASTVAKEAEETQRLAEEQAKLTREQAQRGMAQRSVVKQLESGANLAQQESASTLSKIGKQSNDFELGTKIREKVKGVQTRLKEALSREAEANKKIYFDEAKAKEEAGQFWSQSPAGQTFLKRLKSITDPVNSGKYTQAQVRAANKVMEELSGKKVKGKVIRSEIGKLEATIRDLKEFTKFPAEGAEAQMQGHIREIVNGLEESVYQFAPHGEVFRGQYRIGKQPINMAESPVGKTVTQELEGLKDVFSADATAVPKAVFKSPEQIKYLERMGVSKKTLTPFAEEHTANQLAQFKTSEQITNWLKSAESSYLKEFPDLAKKAEDYSRVFAKNEKLIAGKTEAAGKIKEAVRTGPKTLQQDVQRIQKETQQLQNMSRQSLDYINNNLYKLENAKDAQAATTQARSYIIGLKERGLIEPQEASEFLNKIVEVENQIKDKTAAIGAMKGILPYVAAVTGGTAVLGYGLNRLIGGINAP